MSENEYLTRKSRIDPKLRAAGWDVVPYREGRSLSAYDRCAIEEYPTENGPADYALCVNGAILGIIEAKKVSLGPQSVLVQAERYARGITDTPFNFDGIRVPFLYATNGEVIWYRDARHPLNRSREIAAFYSPDALLERLQADLDRECSQFSTVPDNPRMRPYQREACNAIGNAITERHRAMLVAMATGTGKTFTMVNLIYRLMKAGVAKRVLFLVDRRALAAQAVRAFASFDTEQGLKFDKTYEVYSQQFHRGDLDDDDPFDITVLPNAYLTDPQPEHAFVYVSTIQRMT
ncbi:MAG: DEAD/DEAH box helicase family protein, partial [Methanoculleus horonobensis]|nr:DEAD/DEAH box helicase family protein [Methanoculleus horonobensis]